MKANELDSNVYEVLTRITYARKVNNFYESIVKNTLPAVSIEYLVAPPVLSVRSKLV